MLEFFINFSLITYYKALKGLIIDREGLFLVSSLI